MTAPTRRERLRTATLAEIKDGARRLLVTGGIEAVSLRAIARDMGMTAPAIYRYFPSLDALVTGLAGDLYDELRQEIEAARDAASPDPTGQLREMCQAMRRWAVSHPAEFTLIFGNPARGVTGLADTCADPDHPGARLCAVFLTPFVELTRGGRLPAPPARLLQNRLGGHLVPLATEHGPLPIEVVYAFLSAWTRLYGLVAMEVFGHLGWAVDEPAAFFETELINQLAQFRPADSGEALPEDGTRH